MGGGLVAGTVVELYGAASTGKTQLALQLALTVQLPPTHGGECSDIDSDFVEKRNPQNTDNGRMVAWSHGRMVANWIV
eukprot:jgi/Hompol1/4384/HPOL_007074-RA